MAALPAGAPVPRTRPPQVQAVVTCWPLGWRLGSAPAGICPERRMAWALDDTVPPSFVGYADTATGPLRIEGVADGTILRPVPGKRAVTLEVGAQGASGEVWWMLDGKVYRSGAAGQAQTLTLSRNGRYALTVMDGQGRYAGLEFEISGVTP
ncbi:penicillin-binding protein [Bordetella pertussis]|nr:penicillin-binding protein [Bordetella pertussis]CFP75197.1 penicillin-binding protein [Bordetella pertussis]CPQ23369.1 penicillin-binding protein [Bordetella pertussis]